MIIGISGKIGSGKDTVGQMIQYLSDYKRKGYRHPVTVEDFGRYLANGHHKSSSWKIKKYADKLKEITCLLLGCTREDLEDREFKETVLGEEWWYYKVVDYNGKTQRLVPYVGYEGKCFPEELIKLTPRDIFLLLGTECGRDIVHPNIWVNALYADYKVYIPVANLHNPGVEIEQHEVKGAYPDWIITDVRFVNEVDEIVRREGKTYRIERDLHLRTPYKDIDDFTVNATEAEKFRHTHMSETALDGYGGFDGTIQNNGSMQDLLNNVSEMVYEDL